MNYTNSAVEKVEDALTQTGSELRQRAQTAADSAHDVATNAIHNVAEKAGEVRDAAGPALDRLMARGGDIARDAWSATRETGNQVKKSTGDAVRKCENYVSEQPIRSVVIAMAVGAGIAALLLASRSRHSSKYR